MDRRLTQLADARVLVVGDLILDRYWHGATRRISPEAPVPVVLVDERVERVGGAANVAANVAALGGAVALVGLVGADAEGDTLTRLSAAAGIEPDFLRVDGHATTVKLRVVSQRQQLVRIDFEQALPGEYSNQLLAAVERQLARCEVVVISDYAKGAVARVRDIIERSRAAGKLVIVDPKGTDFSRYAGANLLTPNLAEFEAVAGVCGDEHEIVRRAVPLLRDHQLDAILVTRGAAGMSLVVADGSCHHVPAQAHEVFDVTGAGDTVCGVLAAALATGSDLPTAVGIANAAAGLVVGKFGAATVGVEEIDNAMVSRTGIGRGIVDLPAAVEACARARRRGERIVLTNGCFDILHAGHVRYLSEAKTLGNRLVVAVNDDASVTALKGPRRPYNDLESRMQVLAALDAVDWVVPFSTPTPQQLIATLLPDVLVKGGDYAVDEIVGGAEVRAAGGQVVVLDYHPGHSSSRLIAALADSGSGGT